jgi:hypothetical protein
VQESGKTGEFQNYFPTLPQPPAGPAAKDAAGACPGCFPACAYYDAGEMRFVPAIFRKIIDVVGTARTSSPAVPALPPALPYIFTSTRLLRQPLFRPLKKFRRRGDNSETIP